MIDPDLLAGMVEELAALGEKRAGTPPGEVAAERIRGRLARVLPAVRFESFRFPRHHVMHAELSVRIDGAALLPCPRFDVLEASGSGRIAAPLVDAGAGTVEAIRELALTGSIALVRRQSHLHRSTQLVNLAAAGARAMILVSSAPRNLRQIGSVRREWEAMVPIPAIAIGDEDGRYLTDALAAGRRVALQLRVDARYEVARGRNVVGTLPGSVPEEGVILVGAHYDSWHAGSCDNGAGVAALIGLATVLAKQPRRHGVRFVAFDGEELALYGGYHHLRHHAHDVVAAIDLETPAAHGALVRGLACSRHAVLEQALGRAGLGVPFPLNVSMDLVPRLFGGTIPTDIQGWYRSGTPTLATAVDAPHYHTIEDTPDKVDIGLLAQVVGSIARFIELIDASPRALFASRDPTLFRLEVQPVQRGEVIALVLGANGQPVPAARVELSFLHDDFLLGHSAVAVSDAAGRVVIPLPAGLAASTGGRRFLHLTAGFDHPLAERILPFAH